MEYVLWATKIGAPEWDEQVIATRPTSEQLEPAKRWALANGFDRLRVTIYNGEAPDFSNVVK